MLTIMLTLCLQHASPTHLPQIIAGLFQSTGWPSVVSIVANWFGKGKRGLIMGIWNAHTSVGNIAGTVLSAALLSWVGDDS